MTKEWKTMKRILAGAALVLSMPLFAYAAGMAMDMDSPSSKAFGAANDKMMQDMMVMPTGNTDRDFVTMMIPHHQGAIDMAKIELEFGKDPEIHKLAEGIVAAQEKEIAGMQAWLAAHP
jgi:uncharacterized protein (DUF305 family)